MVGFWDKEAATDADFLRRYYAKVPHLRPDLFPARRTRKRVRFVSASRRVYRKPQRRSFRRRVTRRRVYRRPRVVYKTKWRNRGPSKFATYMNDRTAAYHENQRSQRRLFPTMSLASDASLGLSSIAEEPSFDMSQSTVPDANSYYSEMHFEDDRRGLKRARLEEDD